MHIKDHQKKLLPVCKAELSWQSGQPYSLEFDDIYFRQDGGLEESRYVFLDNNKLPERWAALTTNHFVIAETGFGSGLNFLAAVQLWLAKTDSRQKLHYYSVEKYPLCISDLRKILHLFPEVGQNVKEIMWAYPPLVPGFHRILLFDGRVCLNLAFMDVNEWVSRINIKADAWFLDGFSPLKNPQMWSADLLGKIARLTNKNGTFSTFTAASKVRRGLIDAGFIVNKVKGFLKKREMLIGQLPSLVTTSEKSQTKPWYLNTSGPITQRHVTVIGAGLAGAYTADCLARCGWQVTVIERLSHPVESMSKDSMSVIFSKLSAYDGAEYRFYQQSYLYAIKHIPELLAKSDAWQPCGVLQLAHNEKELIRQQQIIQSNVWPTDLVQPVNATEASELAGVQLTQGGLHFKQAGWLAPYRVSQYLLNRHSTIKIIANSEVIKLRKENNGEWSLIDASEKIINRSGAVVIANAADAIQFEQTAYLPLHKIRGQDSRLSATELSKNLQMVLCYDGYITPAMPTAEGQPHSIGATYSIRDHCDNVRLTDNQENLQRLENAVPSMYNALSDDKGCFGILGSRVGFRCHTPDYLPAIGPVPDLAYYQQQYAMLSKGQLKVRFPEPQYLAGLYMNVGHGSRGLTTTPLCAELLSAYINNDPLPVEESIRESLHPARFIIKALRRGPN